MKEFNFHIFSKVSLVEKYNFYEYLSVMLDGGVSISETLDSVQSKIKNPFFREKIKELQMFVSSGDSISKSMKKIPTVFQSSEIAIIESGEQMGKLSFSLSQLSDNLRKSHDLRSKIKGALTYPFIIFVFLILAIFVVMIFVIPAISNLFMTSGTELPFATRALIASSDFVIHEWYYILFFSALVLVLFLSYRNTQTGRANLDHMLLRIPLIGKVYRNYILAMLATNLSMLISSGVSVVKSLSLSGRSLNNLEYEAHLKAAMEKVMLGEKITESLPQNDESHYLFPLDFLQMLSVGEKTASLDSVCQKLSAQYTREVDYSLANLTKWIEPLAILISGVFVTWFAFAIFGAILQLTQTIS